MQGAVRAIFAGTPEFAAASLVALHASGADIALVLTQPDRPAGRGRKTLPTPVKAAALDLGLRVEQPLSLRDKAAQSLIADVAADIMVVVAYGLLLPEPVLQAPAHGCVNVHASLLPRWRGAAPIQRAIEAGDSHSGVCIMAMEKGLDTGAVYARAEVPIAGDDTAGSLHDRLAGLGAQLLVETLPDILAGAPRTPQPEHGVTYAAKIDKRESRIDWAASSNDIDRKVRAFNPWPMAFTTTADGERLRILATAPVEGDAPAPAKPGTVHMSTFPQVATGDGWLRLARLQAAGGKAVDGDEFARGNRDLGHLG